MMFSLTKPSHEEFVRVALLKSIAAKDGMARRPLTLVICGASGVGKSSLALFWAENTLRFLKLSNSKRLEHLVNEHICYTPSEALSVLDHALHCDVPVFISMEGREALDSRQSISKYNKNITRAITLSRAIKPILLIFCVQRLMDLDVRVRESMNLFGMIRSYITSRGTLIKPEVSYLTIRKKLNNESLAESVTFEPVRILFDGKTYTGNYFKWELPASFELFREVDRMKKEKLLKEKVETEEDSVKAFVEECIVEDAEGEIAREELYKKYVEFCKEREYIPDSYYSFSAKLQELVKVECRKIQRKGSRKYCWVGIRYVGGGENEEDEEVDTTGDKTPGASKKILEKSLRK